MVYKMLTIDTGDWDILHGTESREEYEAVWY